MGSWATHAAKGLGLETSDCSNEDYNLCWLGSVLKQTSEIVVSILYLYLNVFPRKTAVFLKDILYVHLRRAVKSISQRNPARHKRHHSVHSQWLFLVVICCVHTLAYPDFMLYYYLRTGRNSLDTDIGGGQIRLFTHDTFECQATLIWEISDSIKMSQ